jgi:hypothetical protein
MVRSAFKKDESARGETAHYDREFVAVEGIEHDAAAGVANMTKRCTEPVRSLASLSRR